MAGVGVTTADQSKLRQVFQSRFDVDKVDGQIGRRLAPERVGAMAETDTLATRPKSGAPRVRGGQVLYLDFDGVLHHEDVCMRTKRGLFFGHSAQSHGAHNRHSHRLFEHAPLLVELLLPYPDVQIVLSTSWVRWRGYTHARDRLPIELARRCVGATFHRHMNRDAFLQLSRGFQIWLDVERRSPSTWLAIDDDHSDWPNWCRDHLVRSDGEWGIRHPEVHLALKTALASTFGRALLSG